MESTGMESTDFLNFLAPPISSMEESDSVGMSFRSKKIHGMIQRIQSIHRAEGRATGVHKAWLRFSRWFWMLSHEWVRDDVLVRAQSLAFLMLFSLMPIFAGGFLIFTFFAQFGMVQDAIQSGLQRYLETIPEGNREFVEETVLHFKDAYLASIQHKSGTFGIFALVILVWVGLQMFNNIDRVLNRIWSSDRERPFLEQCRNFIVVVVVAPLVIIGGLSVPLILRKMEIARTVFFAIPILLATVDYVVVPALLCGTLVLLYRYVPVRSVPWKAAAIGALWSTLFLELTNRLMRYYFIFGTQSAYGKAASIPLIAFWIYVIWIVIITGAEISYLLLNGKELLTKSGYEPTPRDAHGALVILKQLHNQFKKGTAPLGWEELARATGFGSKRLRWILDTLVRRGWVVACVGEDSHTERFVLARDLEAFSVSQILREIFSETWSIPAGGLGKWWDEGLGHWIDRYQAVKVPDLP